ncbi:hypothetical protein [Salinicoccus kekensis]|uniref:Uncharacterized protein n=1 Tax=Salinicoccus kekensis TaxID=714307 RepID=A0A285U8K6_9STAP|nr:hypothetical protein [Salinicoccus kekensis]SOC38063.1 hypothetical protein SAMN05878391_0283 [Salinicoccus kekensis]
MSLSIDPKEFARTAVIANPANASTADEKAMEALELYLSAYRLAEKYERISTTHSTQETSEILQILKDNDAKM